MRRQYLWLLVGGAMASFVAWSWLLMRMATTRSCEAPAEKPSSSLAVAGHAAERVTATRLSWSIDVCAPALAKADAKVREAASRWKKLTGEELSVTPAKREDSDQDEGSGCASIELTTSRVADAFKWHRGLLSSGIVDRDEATEAECQGDEALAGAKSRTSLAAIADARAQMDALLKGRELPTSGFEASVSYEEGEWDARCERVVTATADLTQPTD
jgi:hypothetical protein